MEVEQARQRILAAALELFDSLPYDKVSLRKVAARAGFSPASIYNYYRDKDALYLDVLKAGFQILLESFRDAVDLEHPSRSLEELIRRFYAFSRDYPSYYDLMFTLPVPKYLDYVGTDMEQAAWDEKTVAVANIRLAEQVVRAGVAKGEFRPDVSPATASLVLLAIAHGIISLHRSGVLPELDLEVEEAYSRSIRLAVEALAFPRTSRD